MLTKKPARATTDDYPSLSDLISSAGELEQPCGPCVLGICCDDDGNPSICYIDLAAATLSVFTTAATTLQAASIPSEATKATAKKPPCGGAKAATNAHDVAVAAINKGMDAAALTAILDKLK
jgi:hypothetical protein